MDATQYQNDAKTIEVMSKKRYRVEVGFQGERYVTVMANNEREAKSKAKKRVRKKPIGNSIRADWVDAEVDPNS